MSFPRDSLEARRPRQAVRRIAPGALKPFASDCTVGDAFLISFHPVFHNKEAISPLVTKLTLGRTEWYAYFVPRNELLPSADVTVDRFTLIDTLHRNQRIAGTWYGISRSSSPFKFVYSFESFRWWRSVCAKEMTQEAFLRFLDTPIPVAQQAPSAGADASWLSGGGFAMTFDAYCLGNICLFEFVEYDSLHDGPDDSDWLDITDVSPDRIVLATNGDLALVIYPLGDLPSRTASAFRLDPTPSLTHMSTKRDDEQILKTLLTFGPGSVRTLAEMSGLLFDDLMGKRTVLDSILRALGMDPSPDDLVLPLNMEGLMVSMTDVLCHRFETSALNMALSEPIPECYPGIEPRHAIRTRSVAGGTLEWSLTVRRPTSRASPDVLCWATVLCRRVLADGPIRKLEPGPIFVIAEPGLVSIAHEPGHTTVIIPTLSGQAADNCSARIRNVLPNSIPQVVADDVAEHCPNGLVAGRLVAQSIYRRMATLNRTGVASSRMAAYGCGERAFTAGAPVWMDAIEIPSPFSRCEIIGAITGLDTMFRPLKTMKDLDFPACEDSSIEML